MTSTGDSGEAPPLHERGPFLVADLVLLAFELGRRAREQLDAAPAVGPEALDEALALHCGALRALQQAAGLSIEAKDCLEPLIRSARRQVEDCLDRARVGCQS